MPFSAAKKKAHRQKPEIKARESELNKQWKRSPAGRKSTRICDWKRMGVICDDFDTLYERYLNTKLCEDCNIELTVGGYNTSTTRCLDHDHTTGLFRNVLCLSCNNKRKLKIVL